jgi:hypothetical protein
VNRFKDLMGALKDRSADDERLKRVLDDLAVVESLERDGQDDRSSQKFRLPYSSDPRPIDEPWN